MNTLNKIWRRIIFLLRRDRFDRELSEEMRLHVEMTIEENLSKGLSREDARYNAMRRFGNAARIQEKSREIWLIRTLDVFCQDIRYALRNTLKNRSISALIIITLALGIGANTAIFSAAEAVFFHSLPYRDAGQFVYLSGSFPNNTLGGDNFSYADFSEWQTHNQSFERMALYQDWVSMTLTGRDEPLRLTTNLITANYLELLGGSTMLGRVFTPDEIRVPSDQQVVIISHDAWKNTFGGDPAIVGQQIHINQAPFTVVGVMRPDFRDIIEPDRPDIDAWIPLGVAPQLLGYHFEDRASRLYWGIARLKPGVDVAAAKAEAATIAGRIAETYPATEKGFSLYAEPFRDHFFSSLYGPLKLLLIGTALVLLIGCANIASLLLARGAGRRREMAVRVALGAGRSRLLGQLLVECLLLSAIAGAVGLLLALWLTHLLNSWSALELPGFAVIRINGLVLCGSLALSLLTGLAFGLAPALEGTRIDIRDVLSQTGRQSGGLERNLTRHIFVVAEVTLSFALLIGAGLMLKSVQTLTNTGLEFRTENLLTLRMDLTSSKYNDEKTRIQFARQLVEKTSSLTGVESAMLWGPAPLGRSTWVMFAAPDGKPINGQEDLTMISRHNTSPGGLGKLGLPLLRGRDFGREDIADAPGVAIVSDSLAKLFWPGQDAIGKRVVRQSPTGLVTLTVVGVAADAKQRTRYVPSAGPNRAFEPQLDIYQAYEQRPNTQLGLVLRTKPGAAILPDVRKTILSLDGDMTFYDVTTLEDRLAKQSGTPRAIASLMTAYALVALFLSGLGLYGVLANLVNQRTQEIGIRLALGGQPRDIFRLIVAQGLRLTVIGLGAGLMISLVLTRFLASLLYGVSATDPMTFAAVAMVLATVAFLACYIPARRATRLDPMIALRYE